MSSTATPSVAEDFDFEVLLKRPQRRQGRRLHRAHAGPLDRHGRQGRRPAERDHRRQPGASAPSSSASAASSARRASSPSASPSRAPTRSGADCIESVNSLIEDLVRPSNEMQRVIGAVADGDLSKKVSADVQGEMLELKNTINGMVDQLNGFISEVTRVAREVGTEGKLGQAAAVHDRGRRRLEGADRQRQPDGRQPHRPGPRHRRGDHRGRQRRPEQEDHRRRARRVPRAQEHRQRDGRPAQPVRRRGHARRARGRRRGQARRPGAVAGGRGRLEGPHRRRQPARGEPDRPGARDRRGRDRRDRGRPDAAGQRGGQRRGRGAQGPAQRDDPQPARDDAPEHRAGLAEDEPRALHPHAPGPARPRDRLEHDPVRAGAAGLGPARRLLRRSPTPATSGEPVLQFQAGYGYKERKHLSNVFRLGEGLVGQCALEKERILLDQRPGRLRPDQLRPGRGAAAEHHRAADPLRGLGPRGHRAGVLRAPSARPTSRCWTS